MATLSTFLPIILFESIVLRESMSLSSALIITSSKEMQSALIGLLCKLDVIGEIATSEEQAWSLLEIHNQRFDMVILGHAALESAASDFVSRLRSLQNFASVPIVLLVENDLPEARLESLYEAGFTQIFRENEYGHLVSGYIRQIQERNTFKQSFSNQILIIEDDLTQQLTIQSILEEHNCECYVFCSAEDALAQVRALNPHVIATDFFLEGQMTALDFIMQIRYKGHKWSQVPVIVMTGLDDQARKYEMVRSGANDYIVKPIDPIDLTVRIENLLRYKHLLDQVEIQRQEMQYLAMHDQLTGLYNRHFLNEQVNIGIAEAIRHGINYSLIILDIDHFKQINDQHGHDVGDKVLKGIGAFLHQRIRENDVVARLGGEEFLMLMNHCDITSASHKAESLRAGIEALRPSGITVTASFGVAQLSQELKNFDLLFKAADQAVYEAKQSGRNRVQISSQNAANSKDPSVSELNQLIDENQVMQDSKDGSTEDSLVLHPQDNNSDLNSLNDGMG